MCLRERFVCQSSVCRREIEVEPSVVHHKPGQTTNPRCICGSIMKKVYSKPVLRKLSKAEVMLLLNAALPLKTESDASK